MDRRKSIKTLLVSSASFTLLAEACKQVDKKAPAAKEPLSSVDAGLNRMKEETEYENELRSRTFFTAAELSTITVLGDIIIPKDEVSGSASDAGVPAFIEFIVKDMPQHQIPLRGGLRWLDLQCLNRFGNAFTGCSQAQQTELIDAIAYPKKAKPEMQQGVAFFNLMRNLVATGFYTSQIGVKDVGYMGNQPNNWNGVPDEVLKQYGLQYSEKELKECISFNA